MVVETSIIDEILDSISEKSDENNAELMLKLQRKIIDPPAFYLHLFGNIKNYSSRLTCVYWSQSYSKVHDSALRLGFRGVEDRSRVVRYRSLRLLAISESDIALEFLENLDRNPFSKDDLEDIDAAMSAIRKKNRNLFIDRQESGRMFITLKIVSEDDLAERFGSDWKSLRKMQIDSLLKIPLSTIRHPLFKHPKAIGGRVIGKGAST